MTRPISQTGANGKQPNELAAAEQAAKEFAAALLPKLSNVVVALELLGRMVGQLPRLPLSTAHG
jgi:hypothetical protein